ncbi:MAG: phosphoribosylamine--glycine ligase [Acetobacteraceae bacterium]|nr:phosphoribosylamine--glycine ligase [Acetobacteraceae bacterium]
MRVLVVGSGGREHALCWALAASPLLTRLWCAPGNPGIAEVAACVPLAVTDIAALVGFARENAVDLVVPGPEAPLVAGLADALDAAGIPCCGPTAAAARLEGSKTFAKEVCDAAGIPTALWERFEEAEAARTFVRRRGAPLVVKADGLAAGKGVVVAATEAEALAAIEALMVARALGEAGASVLIEECLTGEELSFFALCDGAHAIPFGSARDHKRVGEGDTGPNTGGMGAVSPWPGMTPELEGAIMAGIIRPALAEMARRGSPFRGILFAGLMHTADGIKLIEFNARLGDPEGQALLPRLRSDILPALLAACDGELAHFDLRWDEAASVAVVLAARGYPEAPRRGGAISGLERAAALPGVRVFQAGTQRDAEGRLIAAGGRVLTVCATGDSVASARQAAYAGVDAIAFPDGFCRRDIGDGRRE